MKRKYSALSSPLRIGNVTLRNRMVSAPMATPYITKDGLLTWEAAAFYEKRAAGGAAVVTVSEGVTHPQTGQNYTRMLTLVSEDCLGMLTETCRAIQRHGALASIELGHGGKVSETDIQQGYKTEHIVKYGPSDEPEKNGIIIREMPVEIIHEIVHSYARGADLARRAGFDMILIHGGHGWLLNQFLSPRDNQRTDEYGGSTENRARIVLEILDAVRGVVGPDFPIEFRLSAEEYVEGGYELNEAIKIAKLIEPKINLLHVSSGSHDSAFARTHLPMFVPRGGMLHYAAEIKKHINIPVSTIGALNDPEQMEEIIESGQADVCVMARALIADPELPNKVLEGRDDEILKCLRCSYCLASRIENRTRACVINPEIGREFDRFQLWPTQNPKKVLVVGGGPAGMEAALSAAKKGHKVCLCEKSQYLGGAMRSELVIPFKCDYASFIDTKARQLEIAGVDVRLGVEATPEYVKNEAPDALIVAVGASPAPLPIRGIDSKNVVWCNDLSDRINDIGQSVAVLGGGQIGCEIAIYLAQQGKKVSIIEKSAQLSADSNVDHRPIVLDMLKSLGVELHTETEATAITDTGMNCYGHDGELKLAADTILVCAGQRPRYDLVDTFRDSAIIVRTVGDCVKARDIGHAVWSGYHAGLDI